jgi:hypothetical protein
LKGKAQLWLFLDNINGYMENLNERIY